MDIQKLIDKFMNGTSTLDEERLLGEYFRTEKNIPEELEPYRQMFAYFDKGMVEDASLANEPLPCSSAVRHTINARRVLAIAASIAVLIAFAYCLYNIGGEMDKGNDVAGGNMAQTMLKDTLPSKVDSLIKVDEHEKRVPEQRRISRKYRYKPAPPEILVADADAESLADSVDNSAKQMAEAELRRVEYEQQYMQGLIRAVNLLNAADIAAVGDDVDVY